MGLKDNAYLDGLREKVKYIWMNGGLVDFDEAAMHVFTAGAFFGANVFEGLRAYWNEEQDELYAFKLDDHFQRLEEGMKMMRMTPPYTRAEMLQALIDVGG